MRGGEFKLALGEIAANREGRLGALASILQLAGETPALPGFRRL